MPHKSAHDHKWFHVRVSKNGIESGIELCGEDKNKMPKEKKKLNVSQEKSK